jgi:hypothetical protein
MPPKARLCDISKSQVLCFQVLLGFVSTIFRFFGHSPRRLQGRLANRRYDGIAKINERTGNVDENKGGGQSVR